MRQGDDLHTTGEWAREWALASAGRLVAGREFCLWAGGETGVGALRVGVDVILFVRAGDSLCV
jgi:hypothetical protein